MTHRSQTHILREGVEVTGDLKMGQARRAAAGREVGSTGRRGPGPGRRVLRRGRDDDRPGSGEARIP